MSIESSWLTRGYFDLSSTDKPSTTQQIRDVLSASLGVRFTIKSYPVGPAFRRVFWWRVGDSDYSEAQLCAQISSDYPVLSLGVSVEKGFEGTKKGPQMNRRSWAWQRLIRHRQQILSVEIPKVAKQVRRAINLRISTHEYGLESRYTYAFSYVDRKWFERGIGPTTPSDIAQFIKEVDEWDEEWVDLSFAVDLDPTNANGLSAAATAELLMQFSSLWRRLRH